jgi:TDG/mug DNA glycosylase family protein
VLFCGINPGLYSAATGHHFARPGNRFWPALHAGGFTPRVLKPWEEAELLAVGLGITNLVARATAAAEELEPAEMVAGRRRLARKVGRYAPRWVAVLGVGAYRVGFGRPRAAIGPQPERLDFFSYASVRSSFPSFHGDWIRAHSTGYIHGPNR